MECERIALCDEFSQGECLPDYERRLLSDPLISLLFDTGHGLVRNPIPANFPATSGLEYDSS